MFQELKICCVCNTTHVQDIEDAEDNIEDIEEFFYICNICGLDYYQDCGMIGVNDEYICENCASVEDVAMWQEVSATEILLPQYTYYSE